MYVNIRDKEIASNSRLCIWYLPEIHSNQTDKIKREKSTAVRMQVTQKTNNKNKVRSQSQTVNQKYSLLITYK